MTTRYGRVMSSFCLHCGKELRDDELRCPECGAWTEKGVSSGASQRASIGEQDVEKAAIGKQTIILIVILAVAIIALAVIPSIINTTNVPTYDVTVTIESISIDDPYNGLYVTEDGNAPVYVAFGYSSTTNGTLTMTNLPNEGTWSCPVDGTALTELIGGSTTFEMKGTKNDFNFGIFFYDKNNPETSDIIDLYDDSGNVDEGSKAPDYFGCNSVVFTLTPDVDTETITLTGDSTPIGSITFTVTITQK